MPGCASPRSAFALPCPGLLCRCLDGLIGVPLCRCLDTPLSALRRLSFAFFGSCCPAKHLLCLCRAGPCKTRPCRGHALPRLSSLCPCFVMPLCAKPLHGFGLPYHALAVRYDDTICLSCAMSCHASACSASAAPCSSIL